MTKTRGGGGGGGGGRKHCDALQIDLLPALARNDRAFGQLVEY